MSVYNRIKDLANERQMTVAELERLLDLSKGSVGKWAKSSPGGDKIKRIADYFNVTTDYLLGRESYEDMKLKQARWDFIKEEGLESEEFYAIQRKAKTLNKEDQERLLQLMKLTFQELKNEEDDIDDDL